MTRRWWGWPLVPLYATGLHVKDALRSAPKKLAWPVVSVGSLSAGGAGKTPVVMALVDLLWSDGWHVDVLSRGYGRSGSGVARVSPELADAATRFGDEPVLIAQRTGVTVWVARDRFSAGETAEYAATEEPYGYRRENSRRAVEPARHVHLLDDGFQHQQLARAMDVVLVTAEDLDDALLPAGNRREPLTALERADALVVRMEERESVLPRLKKLVRPGVPVWIVRRKLKFASPLAMLGAGLRPMAFCAIARPEDFERMVKAAGCGLVDTLAFADHHPYTLADVDEIVATAVRLKASGFVTTEKDAVKLTDPMRAKLAEVGPLLVARLEADFGDPKLVTETIAERLR